MRILIQRVSGASVSIGGERHSAIGPGLLILVGIEEADTDDDIAWLTEKAVKLRIFADESGVMNRSVADVGGEVLVVSQFTLHASTRKGARPSYIRAAPASVSEPMYGRFVARLVALLDRPVATGVFGADMQVALINDGPVTIWIDSKNRE